jgi:hypothetical protein
MKKIGIIASVLLMSSCNSKDEQFCKCLEAGEKLNNYSAELMPTEITKDNADSLKFLKAAKKEACQDYQTMKGPEMLKKKAECQ